MSYFPVFLDLQGQPATVIGGSSVAERRVEALRAAGAVVRVIAPELTDELEGLAAAEAIEHLPRAYRPGDLAGARLVISERFDRETHLALWSEATALGIPVNVEDEVDCCSFILSSVLRRGDLQIAISTAGRAPALAVRLRQQLEGWIGEHFGRFLELVGPLREPLAKLYPEFQERRRRWYRLVDSKVLPRLAEGDEEAALEEIHAILGVPRESALTAASRDLGAAAGEAAP